MSTILDTTMAAEDAAGTGRGAAEPILPGGSKAVALRLAGAADTHVLKLLAELDEEPVLSGEVLLAVIDGEAVAAMSLDDGRVIADPFVASGDAVSLLKLRGRQLLGAALGRRRWRPRFA